MDSLPTPRRRRSNSPTAPPSAETMQTLRLPPLRFLTQNPNTDFNCVLPPITPPPSRLSPSTNNIPWHHSPAIPSTLPSPSPISPAARLPSSSRTLHSDDARLSPITHTPPSTIRPLPRSSLLPAPDSAAAYSSNPTSPHQHHPHSQSRSYPDSYPTQSPSSSQSAIHLSPPDQRYTANHQNYGLMPRSPVAPWNQSSKLPRPAELAAPIQVPPHYRDINQSAPIQHSQKQVFPTLQSLPSQQETPGMLPAVGGYYNDGTPIQRMNPLKQEPFLTTSALVPSAPGPSTQPPQLQEATDVKSPLKTTMKTERGVRDVYACPYPNCKRVSTEQSNMKAHMRMHTGEKPYVCRNPGCMKAFRWKSSLTYHEKALHVKSRPFKCSPCRRSFVEKRKLRMHFDLCPVIRRHKEQEEKGDDRCMQ